MEGLVEYATSFVGLPYRWGGDDPMAGFDCSGLVQEILASVGEDPAGDQTAHTLYRHFSRHGYTPPENEWRAGDLAFFGTQQKIRHVGFCVDSFRMVEAGGGGSNIHTLQDAEQANAYIRIRPVKQRTDFYHRLRPEYIFHSSKSENSDPTDSHI